MARKDAIARAESASIRNNLGRHSVTYLEGLARFVDPHAVVVEGRDGPRRVEGDYFLIATGSVPRRPPDIDFTDDHIYDSDEILTIDKLPGSLIVLGGGVIGCEYACMFAALGVRVTLVDTRDEILPFLDLELVERLRVGHAAPRHRAAPRAALERRAAFGRPGHDPGSTTARSIAAEYVLFAAGREGRTKEPRFGRDRRGMRHARLRQGRRALRHARAAAFWRLAT